MVAYLTLDIDGFDMLTSGNLHKRDIILCEKEGVVHAYQVTNADSKYPKKIKEYYFGKRHHAIVELKRIKFQEFPDLDEGTFEVTFLVDGEEFKSFFDTRPSVNQVFYVGGKLVQVIKNVKKDKKKLTFDTETITTKPMELFYVSEHGDKWMPHSSFNDYVATQNKHRK